jgi:peptidoglycan/LPS O-acetylase OafA/YrhL
VLLHNLFFDSFRFHHIEVNRRACAIPLYPGKISYGIYLWHQIVLDILKKHTQGGLLVAATLAVVVGLSSLSWAFLKKPILRKAQSPAPREPCPYHFVSSIP